MARVWQRVCEKTTTSNPDYEGGVFEVTLLTLDFAASVTTTFWGGRESYCVHHNLHASSRTWNCKWAMPSTFHPGQSFFSVFVCNHFYFVSQTDKRTEHCPSKRLSIYLCICLRVFLFCFRKCKFHPFLAQCNVNDILANEMQLFVSSSSVVEWMDPHSVKFFIRNT